MAHAPPPEGEAVGDQSGSDLENVPALEIESVSSEGDENV